MLNKKIIFIFACLLACFFIYSESGKLGYIYDRINPHHEYYFNNNGKRSRYRIQMHTPHYAFCLDTETCSYYECFPNFEMGFHRETGDVTYDFPNCSILWIFPEIIFKDENLKEVFSIKGISRDEAGHIYNCYASNWEIYEKGLVLDVLLWDVWKAWKRSNEYTKKVKKVYLELKDDGKYYETENTNNFGKLRKSYSAYDFLDGGVDLIHVRKFYFYGYSIYKMGNGRKIESVLIHNILFYNKTEDGIEFITPCGCGFFDFKTESMSLVSKDKYLGKKFTYAHYYKESKKAKEKTKIIAEEDFMLPDKVPLNEYDLEAYSNWKQAVIEIRKKEQLLNFE